MSQLQVARAIGVTPDTVTGWELNRNKPTAKIARKTIEFIEYVRPSGEMLRFINNYTMPDW